MNVRIKHGAFWVIMIAAMTGVIEISLHGYYFILTRQGIEIVDPTDALIEAAKNERMYYWLDAHWTRHGHAIVARVLGDYLLSSSYIRQRTSLWVRD